jgi:hypothetical protein
MINVWRLLPLRGSSSANVRSITVLTVSDSASTRGAPASTVMFSEAEPSVISKSMSGALDVKDHVRLD